MGGGLMQLVAMGAQDVYLTGNPQITFFKVVYRRHTNFSKECIEQTFNGTSALGSSLTCTLARNGDLVQEIYFRSKLKSSAASEGHLNNIIKSVEVEIGGQKIDKHYSEWLNIYDELFETNNTAVKAMRSDGVNADGDTISYIPLRFWFNRNPGLALPLIALQYHEVKVNVQLASVTELSAVAASPFGTNTKVTELKDAALLVNYLYLDTDERRRFAQVSHEYLIEQVQHTGVETKAKMTLNFNHPVKALFWAAKNGSATDTVLLQLNGHDRFKAQEWAYFNHVQPYECGLGGDTARIIGAKRDTTAASVSMYSFCLKPGEHQPSGTCNFSRIDNAVLNLGSLDTTIKNAYVFALNYNVLRIMSGMGGLAYSN